jgi:hypothetical protein
MLLIERGIEMLSRREIMHEGAIAQLKALRSHVLLDETLGGLCRCQLCEQVRKMGATLKLDREVLVQINGSDLSS